MKKSDVENRLADIWEDAIREIYTEWCIGNSFDVCDEESRSKFILSEANEGVKNFVETKIRWFGEDI